MKRKRKNVVKRGTGLFIVAIALACFVACNYEDPNELGGDQYAELGKADKGSDGNMARLVSARAKRNCIEEQRPGFCLKYEGYVAGYVDVKNIAYHKKVVVHYTTNGSKWQEAQASYDSQLDQGWELVYLVCLLIFLQSREEFWLSNQTFPLF